LVAIGQAGLYDQWRRARATPGLAGLSDGQAPGRGYQEKVRETDEEGGTATRKEVGQGRAAYLPALRFDGPLPAPAAFFTISNRYWKRPANWQEFTDAVRWAARDDLPVRVDGPPHLVANLVSQPAPRRLLLHLLNYHPTAKPIDNATLRCQVPATTIRIYSPDADVLTATARPDGTFCLPTIRTYSIVVIDDPDQ
jgi:hypothetical protein